MNRIPQVKMTTTVLPERRLAIFGVSVQDQPGDSALHPIPRQGRRMNRDEERKGEYWI